MALIDITRPMVLRALKEFDQRGRDAMLERYSSGPKGKSTRWYILFGGRHFDQKVILRAAHELSGPGPLPPGRGTFNAAEAKRRLKKLDFQVVGDITTGSLLAEQGCRRRDQKTVALKRALQSLPLLEYPDRDAVFCGC